MPRSLDKLAARLAHRFAIVPLVNTAGQVCRVPLVCLECFELMGPLRGCPKLAVACQAINDKIAAAGVGTGLLMLAHRHQGGGVRFGPDGGNGGGQVLQIIGGGTFFHGGGLSGKYPKAEGASWLLPKSKAPKPVTWLERFPLLACVAAPNNDTPGRKYQPCWSVVLPGSSYKSAKTAKDGQPVHWQEGQLTLAGSKPPGSGHGGAIDRSGRHWGTIWTAY